jgi:hypothetical protein
MRRNKNFIFGRGHAALWWTGDGWMLKGINLEKDQSQALAVEGLV